LLDRTGTSLDVLVVVDDIAAVWVAIPDPEVDLLRRDE
jgi:hypothetical protein